MKEENKQQDLEHVLESVKGTFPTIKKEFDGKVYEYVWNKVNGHEMITVKYDEKAFEAEPGEESIYPYGLLHGFCTLLDTRTGKQGETAVPYVNDFDEPKVVSIPSKENPRIEIKFNIPRHYFSIVYKKDDEQARDIVNEYVQMLIKSSV